VDRVDAATVPDRPNEICLTVMDYKSGSKRFEPRKMEAGLQLQLPAYLAALCAVADGSSWLAGRRPVPAGMFYVRLKSGSERIAHRNAGSGATAAKRFEHTGRFSFEHLPLFDRRFDDDGGGQFTYSLRKDGRPHGASKQLIEQAALESLLADTEARIRKMGADILAGKVAVDPSRKGAELPCTWCEFKAICRIDPWTHAYRPLRPILEPAAVSGAGQ
jgi:ATP-dependent helicase/nuclease subunit B